MKKIFRFKYEPCTGSCYHPQELLFKELNKLAPKERLNLIARAVYAHNLTCDNPLYFFGVDYDEVRHQFMGFVTAPTQTELCLGSTLSEVIDGIIDILLILNIPKISGHCEFNGSDDSNNLYDLIISQCANVA